MRTRKPCIVVGLVAALAACGGSGTDKNQSAAVTGAQPAGATTALEAKPREAEPAALVIQVYQEDSDAGVAAEVSKLDDTGAAHFVADVDDTGIARLSQPCAAGERFEAKPKVEAFLRVAPQPCAPTVTFRLYNAQVAYNLVLDAETAEKAGNFAAAQANYGLAAERFQFSKPAESERLKVLASRNVGKLLGVDDKAVLVNGTHRIAPAMVNKLKLYQHNANIPVTGVIDEKTREALLMQDKTTGAAK